MNNNGSFESTEVFIFTKDHLGSIRELSDLQQNPIQRYNYSAYGRTRIEKLNANSEHFVVNPYAYTSRELDESGDYFYRARYYDAWNGRFLSLDPIGFAGGDESLYRYVRNDPIRYTDPEGKISPAFYWGAMGIGLAGLYYHDELSNFAADPQNQLAIRALAYATMVAAGGAGIGTLKGGKQVASFAVFATGVAGLIGLFNDATASDVSKAVPPRSEYPKQKISPFNYSNSMVCK